MASLGSKEISEWPALGSSVTITGLEAGNAEGRMEWAEVGACGSSLRLERASFAHGKDRCWWAVGWSL